MDRSKVFEGTTGAEIAWVSRIFTNEVGAWESVSVRVIANEDEEDGY